MDKIKLYMYNIMPKNFKDILVKLKNKKKDNKNNKATLEKEEHFDSPEYIIPVPIFHCKSDTTSKKINIPILLS